MRQGGQETGIAIIAARHVAEPPDAAALQAAADAEPPLDLFEAPACDPTEAASLADGDTSSADAVPPDAPVADPPDARSTVFTARYRLTLKGPERGRWEVDVVEEADAPLLTVEVVVRGVQRRSGEAAEAERLGPEALAELALPEAAPTITPGLPPGPTRR
jgi:hypothetical protein